MFAPFSWGKLLRVYNETDITLGKRNYNVTQIRTSAPCYLSRAQGVRCLNSYLSTPNALDNFEPRSYSECPQVAVCPLSLNLDIWAFADYK